MERLWLASSRATVLQSPADNLSAHMTVVREDSDLERKWHADLDGSKAVHPLLLPMQPY